MTLAAAKTRHIKRYCFDFIKNLYYRGKLFRH